MAEYMEYKNSGIPWIGDIPAHWDIQRGKKVLTLLDRPVKADDEVITCFRDGEVTLRKNRREDGFTLSLQEIGYQGIEPGDLIIHGMDGFAGSIGVSDSRGKATPVLNVMDSAHNKRFLMYYLRMAAYKDVFMSLSTGIRVRSCDLRWNKLSVFPFVLPERKEQDCIVAHIDDSLAKIDAIIAEAKASIEEYKAWKASIIYEAVTEGLDPNVEMKDSGVEWIGNIPQLFHVCKIKTLAKRINVGVVIRPSEYFDENGAVPFLRGLNIKEFRISDENMIFTNDEFNAQLSKSIIHTDDVLIVRDGSIGTACVVPPKYDGANVVSLIIVTPNDNTSSQYLCYCLNSLACKRQFDLTKIGSALTHTSVSAVSNILVTIPPLEMQKEIVSYLDSQCGRIDLLINVKESLISDLEAYKKSLIFEVVTGKRRVC